MKDDMFCARSLTLFRTLALLSSQILVFRATIFRKKREKPFFFLSSSSSLSLSAAAPALPQDVAAIQEDEGEGADAEQQVITRRQSRWDQGSDCLFKVNSRSKPALASQLQSVLCQSQAESERSAAGAELMMRTPDDESERSSSWDLERTSP